MFNNKTEARLAQGYRTSPQYSYEKLLDSSTRLNPYRKVYTKFRVLNDVEGISMRR